MRVENLKVYGLEESIMASKYPMATDIKKLNSEITDTVNKLAMSEKGEGHDQALTGINVQFDLTCSNKMWVEAERYRFLYFVSSQSTMHRITKFNLDKQYNSYVHPKAIELMKELVNEYNIAVKNGEDKDTLKEMYLRILYSNPAGFELTARLTTNYRQLKTIYSQRKSHRLPEWRAFCEQLKTLPHSEWITLER